MRGTRPKTVRIVRRLAVGALLLGASGIDADARAQTAPDIAITRASARTPQLAPRENFTGVARVSWTQRRWPLRARVRVQREGRWHSSPGLAQHGTRIRPDRL